MIFWKEIEEIFKAVIKSVTISMMADHFCGGS